MHSFSAIRALLSFTVLLRSVAAQGVEIVVGLNPGDVPTATRQAWCQSETKTCSQICQAAGQRAKSNTCDYNVLSSLCECGDGSFPDVSQFSNSLLSLACNFQLAECLDGTTSAAAQSSCQYQYLCGGRNPLEALGASSISTPTSTAFSTSTKQSTATAATTTLSSTSKSREHLSDNSPSYGWIAGLAIGLTLTLLGIILGLWWLKRRRGQRKEADQRSVTESTKGIWTDKQELDGTPIQRPQLHNSPSSAELSASRSDLCSELEGSEMHPAELDGSNPLPQELRTVSERLVRSNAYRSPISPASPLSQYSWTGEVSPAASTIIEKMYK